MSQRLVGWSLLFLCCLVADQAIGAQTQNDDTCGIAVVACREQECTEVVLFRSEGEIYIQDTTVESTDGYGIWSIVPSSSHQMLALQEVSVDYQDYQVAILDFTMPGILETTILPDVRLRDFAWSHGGDQLLLESEYGNLQLYSYDLESQTLFFLPTHQPTSLEIFEAAWSPDDELIAFLARERHPLGSPEYSDFALYVARPFASEYRIVSDPEMNVRQFVWLSDERLAFTSCRLGICRLSVVTSDGVEEFAVVGDYSIWGASPTTPLLVLSEHGIGDFGLLVFNVETGQQANIGRVGGSPDRFFIEWSPDGRYIAYPSNVDGSTQLLITDVVSLVTQEVNLPGHGLDWHPDSNRFLTYDYDRGNVYIYDIEAADTVHVITLDPNEIDYAPVWVCPESP